MFLLLELHLKHDATLPNTVKFQCDHRHCDSLTYEYEIIFMFMINHHSLNPFGVIVKILLRKKGTPHT